MQNYSFDDLDAKLLVMANPEQDTFISECDCLLQGLLVLLALGNFSTHRKRNLSLEW